MENPRGTAIGKADRRIAENPAIDDHATLAPQLIYEQRNWREQGIKRGQDYRDGQKPYRLQIADQAAVNLFYGSRGFDCDNAATDQPAKDRYLFSLPFLAQPGGDNNTDSESRHTEYVHLRQRRQRPDLPTTDTPGNAAEAVRRGALEAEGGHQSDSPRNDSISKKYRATIFWLGQ
jgi:hypothetical protein